MIRILQCVNIMDRAGLETMLMNYYRNIDRTLIQFDFLTHRAEIGDYEKEIMDMGGRVYHAPRLYPQNYPTYFKWMKNFFTDHPEYTIVHSHIDSMSYLPLLAAKKAGVPVRIAHSHNTKIQMDLKYPLKQYFRYKINSVCNFRLACGQEAGRHLFGTRKFHVIPNAICANDFLFDDTIRREKRDEIGIKNELIIGHVGRFSYQKNHEFLIEIFNEILKLVPDTKLLLIGVGKKENQIKKQMSTLGIDDSIVFLGNRSDVNELYQAMDVFVMPSRFEGIPVVGIEAQFSSLPCVFSTGIPKETKFSENVRFIDLSKSSQEWAKNVIDLHAAYNKRRHTSKIESKYDIASAYKTLEDYYLKLENRI